MRTILPLLALAGLLAGCGSVKPLRPAAGMGEVPRAETAERRETPDELMQPSTQAQPGRQADLLLKSDEREEDPFDLPPGKDNGRAPD